MSVISVAAVNSRLCVTMIWPHLSQEHSFDLLLQYYMNQCFAINSRDCSLRIIISCLYDDREFIGFWLTVNDWYYSSNSVFPQRILQAKQTHDNKYVYAYVTWFCQDPHTFLFSLCLISLLSSCSVWSFLSANPPKKITDEKKQSAEVVFHPAHYTKITLTLHSTYTHALLLEYLASQFSSWFKCQFIQYCIFY